MLNTNSGETSVAVSAHWLKQMQLFSALNAKALESMTKLAELNMQVMQDVLKTSSTAFQKNMSVETRPASSLEVQPAIDNALSYSRQVAAIALNMRSECARLAQENVATFNQQLATGFDDLVSKAPEGTRDALGLLQAACTKANSGCEQLLKASEKTAGELAASLSSATTRLTPTSVKNGKNTAVQ